MGFLERVFGKTENAAQARGAVANAADQQAIERYRYLLRTAPPDALEQAHAEAFAQLTAAQRQQLLSQLAHELPPGEQAPTAEGADPRALARMATRAELRQPAWAHRQAWAWAGS